MSSGLNRQTIIDEFEKKGEDSVALLINTDGYNTTIKPIAIEWLAGKKAASNKRKDAYEAETLRVARSAEQAAWRAAKFAAIAILVGVTATIVTILAWIFPRFS